MTRATTGTNTVARVFHDVGAAAWFGGGLMGAVGLNGASARVDDPLERAAVAAEGWSRWAPVSAVAIVAHLCGAAVIGNASNGRVVAQRGMASVSLAKVALTTAALAATAWSGLEGRRVRRGGLQPAAGATEAHAGTDDDVARAQERLRALQWAVPVLTGGVLVTGARLEELWRPTQVGKGVLDRVVPGR